MVTKAIIQEVLNHYTVKLRIPIYNKLENVNGSTPNNELSITTLCTLPNFLIKPEPGDIVIVAFEEGDISKPIVIGYLSINGDINSIVDIKSDNLEVQGDITLGSTININNEVKYENIFALKNQTENIKEKFQFIDKDISNINNDIGEIEGDISNINKDINGIRTDIGKIEGYVNTLYRDVYGKTINGVTQDGENIKKNVKKQLEDITSDINTLNNTTIPNLKSDLENYINNALANYVKKYPTIIGENSYGLENEKPTNPEDGQLYFTLLENQ